MTYGITKPFRSNTYEKVGGGGTLFWRELASGHDSSQSSQEFALSEPLFFYTFCDSYAPGSTVRF